MELAPHIRDVYTKIQSISISPAQTLIVLHSNLRVLKKECRAGLKRSFLTRHVWSLQKPEFYICYLVYSVIIYN